MNTAKRILFLIGGIMSICAAIAFFFLSIMFIALSNMKEEMQKLADDSAEYGVEYFQALFLVLGIMFIFFLILAIINIILSFKGRNSNSKGLMIANIVFGALSGIEVNLVAGIFGLIARNMAPKQKIEE